MLVAELRSPFRSMFLVYFVIFLNENCDQNQTTRYQSSFPDISDKSDNVYLYSKSITNIHAYFHIYMHSDKKADTLKYTFWLCEKVT